MKNNIYILGKDFEEPQFEFVERKGLGHPDTLADQLGERLSAYYSKYTKEKFGAVLHHNFDKTGLLGGSSYVKFGEGYIVNPIRILLNGRASIKFGDEEIDIYGMQEQITKDFMDEMFPGLLDVNKDLVFHHNISTASSPGKTDEKSAEKGTRKYWFEPRSLEDLRELKHLGSNDTSLGVGYSPYSRLESIVLKIENLLNSKEYKSNNPRCGTDIKVMGTRLNNSFDITLCVPQISKYVSNQEQYKNNLNIARKDIENLCRLNGIDDLKININTRDNFELNELYLTAIGSSIESGDEGLVGRGNRINGVISPLQPMSMEGACGKNPVYHIGKLYYLGAQKISEKIFDTYKIRNEVFLVSQSGRDLVDPRKTLVYLDANSSIDFDMINSLVEQELLKMPLLTEGIINSQYSLW